EGGRRGGGREAGEQTRRRRGGQGRASRAVAVPGPAPAGRFSVCGLPFRQSLVWWHGPPGGAGLGREGLGGGALARVRRPAQPEPVGVPDAVEVGVSVGVGVGVVVGLCVVVVGLGVGVVGGTDGVVD